MKQREWQPPGTSTVGQEIDTGPPPHTRFIASCSGIDYALSEGWWLDFGRDDSACSMTVWECIRSDELSRIAGVMWCLDGELWVRNLSSTHELIVGGGSTPQQLPPRRSNHRGAACSVDPSGGWICAPSTGSWQISIRAVGDRPVPDGQADLATVTLGRPPEELLLTAVAMCAPLLRRGDRPSTYQEIADLTDARPRTARDRVDRLVQHYAHLGAERLTSRLDADQSNYSPLARLLVYRSIITHDDLGLLGVTSS